MSNRLALPALALLLAGLLALIFTGIVQDVLVVPLLYLLWLMRVLIESIPQIAIWAGFLAIVAIVAWKSLPMARQVPAPRARAPGPLSPVETWAEMFERAERDHYARWLLAQRLGQLALERLVHQDQRPVSHPWHYLQDESLGMPPAIQAYLRAGMRMYQPPRRMRRLWPPGAQEAAGDPLDLDPEVAVRFLENRLNSTTGETL
jgi:hypothetical protein